MTTDAVWDVVVAGAGLPGLAFAAAAAQAGLSVAIADAAPIGVAADDETGFDLRVFAVSPGSAEFLRSIGAWQRLAGDRMAPIEAMDVRADRGARLEFSAFELGERALAWVVEERALRNALAAAALEAGVEPFGGAPFVGLQFAADRAVLTLSGHTLAGRLLVAADGVRSWVRQAAGILTPPRPYGQQGVVAHFACERAHHGTARQWFRNDGSVLAWLPLPERQMSMVWSAPDALATELLTLEPQALAQRVADAGGHALGALQSISASAGFPLALLRLATTVGHRLALVGDAAHGVHPLAGQGVNLGFGDARALTEALSARGPLTDPGAALTLGRYARRRTEPVFAMQAVTDGLVRLFGLRQPGIAFLRNVGMAAVDRFAPLKRALAQPALR